MKYPRDMTIERINKSETVQEIATQLMKIERGITFPFIVQKLKEDQKAADEDESDQEDNYVDEDKITAQNLGEFRSWRMAFPCKLWPNKDLYELWSNYTQLECVNQDFEALNALYLSVRLFEFNVLAHIEQITEKKQKKI